MTADATGAGAPVVFVRGFFLARGASMLGRMDERPGGGESLRFFRAEEEEALDWEAAERATGDGAGQHKSNLSARTRRQDTRALENAQKEQKPE